MADVTLREVTKVFPGGATAVDRVDLEIDDGELLVLVGPSGSGKTTVLRLTAGPGGADRRARSASADASSTTSTRWTATSRWSSRTTRSTRT